MKFVALIEWGSWDYSENEFRTLESTDFEAANEEVVAQLHEHDWKSIGRITIFEAGEFREFDIDSQREKIAEAAAKKKEEQAQKKRKQQYQKLKEEFGD